MSMSTDKVSDTAGSGLGIESCEHDLIHELGRRLSCLWGYDQYIANASDWPELQDFWRDVQSQDQRAICQVKELLEQQAASRPG